MPPGAADCEDNYPEMAESLFERFLRSMNRPWFATSGAGLPNELGVDRREPRLARLMAQAYLPSIPARAAQLSRDALPPGVLRFGAAQTAGIA